MSEEDAALRPSSAGHILDSGRPSAPHSSSFFTLDDDRQGPPPFRTSRKFLLTALIASALTTAMAWGGAVYCLDDAYIHLSYAQSIRAGHGWSYNPHDGESGASSPLWVVLLVLLPSALHHTWAVKCLGATLHLLGTVFDFATLRSRLVVQPTEQPSSVPLIALALTLAVVPDLVQGATSGMEVALARLTVSAAIWALFTGRSPWAAAASAAAILSRPECLPVLGVLATVTVALYPRASAPRRAALASLLASAAACLVWLTQTWLQTNSWIPNPVLVKARPGWQHAADQGRYVLDAWLPWQPWWLSGAGVVLITTALLITNQRRFTWAIAAATLAAVVGVVATRELHPQVLYFERRYFAPFCGLPLLLCALGSGWWWSRGRWWRLAGVMMTGLVIVVGALTTLATATHKRRDEQSILRLHVEPATWVAQHLPKDTVIAVEGAGALRFFTPPTMRVIDVLGLNHRKVATAATDRAKVCAIAAEAPAYFALPLPIYHQLDRVFRWTVVQRFVDPAYSLVKDPGPMEVLVLQNRGLSPALQAYCRDLPRPSK